MIKLAVIALFLGPAISIANSITINASASGWYNQDGRRNLSENYFTGWLPNGGDDIHRSYFVFQRPALGPTNMVIGAELRLQNPADGYHSADQTETIQFVDVLTPLPQLLTTVTPVRSIFDDLGSGVVYGSKVVSAADNGQIVSITLNSDAINAINSVALGEYFSLGAHMPTAKLTPGQYEYVFGLTDATNIRQLVLTTVPEPSITAWLIGVMALVKLRRRQRVSFCRRFLAQR